MEHLFLLVSCYFLFYIEKLNYSGRWSRVRWELLVGKEYDTQRFSARWHCRELNANDQPLAFLWWWWWDISKTGFFRALTSKLGREIFNMQTTHLTSPWRLTRVSDLKGTTLVSKTIHEKMAATGPTHKKKENLVVGERGRTLMLGVVAHPILTWQKWQASFLWGFLFHFSLFVPPWGIVLLFQ